MRLRTAQAWSRSGRSSITEYWNRSTRRSLWSRRCCLQTSLCSASAAHHGRCGDHMIAGRGTPDQEPARLFAYGDPAGFAGLIDKLVEASASYLVRQLQVGVDVVQIFDTWAGVLPAEEFTRWCIEPTQRIIAEVRRHVPGARMIGFPRGVGTGLALCRGRPDRCRGARLDRRPRVRAIRSSAACRCREISTRWCWSQGAA